MSHRIIEGFPALCNLTNTPTLYVLDPRAVIRYKWVGGPGEKAIDAALEELM